MAMNKWEFASQVGSIALHRNNGFVSILVGQPGGTVTQITEKPTMCSTVKETQSKQSTAPGMGLGSSNNSTTFSSAGGTTVSSSEFHHLTHESQT